MITRPSRLVRPSYRQALRWIAENDGTNWLRTMTDEEIIPSVTACLVADLFGKTEEATIRDLRRVLKRSTRCHHRMTPTPTPRLA